MYAGVVFLIQVLLRGFGHYAIMPALLVLCFGVFSYYYRSSAGMIVSFLYYGLYA